MEYLIKKEKHKFNSTELASLKKVKRKKHSNGFVTNLGGSRSAREKGINIESFLEYQEKGIIKVEDKWSVKRIIAFLRIFTMGE